MPELPGSSPHGKWIFGIFSDPEGNAEFGAVLSLLAFLAALGWVTYLVYRNHQLPDLGGPTMFVSGTFGLHKITNAIKSFGNK